MKRTIESLSRSDALNTVGRFALWLTILSALCFEAQAQTWSPQTSGTTNNLFSIHFVNANEGWAAGLSNTILHTTDSGVNWSPVSSPGGVPVSSYLGVRFIDSNTGWVGGGSVTMRTTNGGTSWNALVDVTAGDFINNLFATSVTQAWAPVSRTGGRFFARYTAQGDGTLISESFDNLSGASVFLDIFFTDPDNGWAVGSPGFIRRITNASTGTVTFTAQTSGTAQTLNGIFMLDANTGWTVGNAGTILNTTNGGTNWTPQTSGTTTNLRSIHFIDANQGWTVGESGLILTTTNGGTNWTQEGSGVTTQTLRRVFSINPVFAAGFAGTILRRDQPSKADLVAFTATGLNDGQMLLQWQTDYEIDNLGFNLYREHKGKRVKLTPELIAGSALMTETALTAGRAYAWWDKGIADCGSSNADCKNAQYWLEDIDLHGASTWHGPFYSKHDGGAPPSRSQAAFLSNLWSRQSESDATRSVERIAAVSRATGEQHQLQSLLARRPAVKISIKREGWYRVTQPELVRAGLSPKLDPRNLQLVVGGKEQPILVASGKDGSFDASSAIEFYGYGLNTPSTDTDTYWLSTGEKEGKRIQQLKGAGAPWFATGFTQTVERRDRTIYFAGLLNGERENFFGAVIASAPVDQTLTLTQIDSSASEHAALEVNLQGVTVLPHRVIVQLNGDYVGEITFSGQQQGAGKFSVQHSALRDGANTVRLIAQNGASDVSLVDSIRLSYQHTFTADNDELKLTAAGHQQVTINGFTSKAIRVFDVTNSDAVQELIGEVTEQENGNSITVASQETGQRTLLALAEGREKQPASVRANQESSLRSPANAADFVIITSRDFLATVESLRVACEGEGYRVAVVDVEDVYDEFNFGIKSPQSIKDFLSYANANWSLAPRFVLFVGDASLDPKNYLGFGVNDPVPTRLVDTSYLETASDDWFADFNDDGVAEMAVGRLPVRTPEEAASVISKILHYNLSKPSQSALLVSDMNQGYNFEQASMQLRAVIPAGTNVEEIRRSQLDPVTAKARLLDAINRGQKIVNYYGHGSMNAWKGSLLTSSDASSFKEDRLSMFVMMTCLNGYFQDPAFDSLAEALLKAEHGGAIAAWASSGMTLPQDQSVMNESLYRLLFSANAGKSLTLGEAIQKTKATIANNDVRRSWILLGDPTTILR